MYSNTMKPLQIGKFLLLLVIGLLGALCQDMDSTEEPVTTEYFFNRDINFGTNVTSLRPSEEEAENITQQVLKKNKRTWFQNSVPNDEYITSCGGMSTSAKTIWQNSEYPRMEDLPGFCTLNLLPPAGTCALKFYFADLDLLPAEDNFSILGDYCSPSKPFFKASILDDFTSIYCYKLDDFEAILDVSNATDPTILLLQLDPSTKFQFKVYVTAVNCNDIKTYESPSDCGIKNQDLATLCTELFGDAREDAARRLSKPNRKRNKGEQTTHLNEWPWIVYIEKKFNSSSVHGEACNGLLLDNFKVLTSRNCVWKIATYEYSRSFGAKDLSVRIGDHDLSSTTETKSKTVGVSKITVPLNKGLYDQKNAFAILHLKEEVKVMDTIRPI